MNEKKLIYTFSNIVKEEDVKSLDHNIIPNTFVLEITHPFPGYYFGSQFVTSESKPKFILLVLKNKAEFDFFYRAIKRIKKYSDFEFEADLAEIELFNQQYHAIRIANLPSYDKLVDIQQSFIDEGIGFRKSKRVEAKALIKINKFISLEQNKDYYEASDSSGFVYFGVEKELSWKMFEHITIKIKHNFTSKFDAGIGVFFHHGDIEDVIRIYSKDLEKEDIIRLKEMYLRELNNY